MTAFPSLCSVPKVLIIDDNEGARTTLSGLLRLEGFATGTADTGYRGIELALADTADVILVDLHLLDVSGVEVVRTLKARGVQALVIIMTVFPDLEYIPHEILEAMMDV